MRRRRRQGNSISQKTNNSIEDLLGNEEYEYSVLDPNRTMINMTKDINDVHKKFLKEEIMNDLIDILTQKPQKTVKQNAQNELKEYQDTTIKTLERTKKQPNELSEDFNKHQSETKETFKKEIYELRITTQNIKVEMNKDMETSGKNQTKILEIKSS
jgi:hypothetical protein